MKNVMVPAPVPPRKAGGRVWKLDEHNEYIPVWKSGTLIVGHMDGVYVWYTSKMVGFENSLKGAMVACAEQWRKEHVYSKMKLV